MKVSTPNKTFTTAPATLPFSAYSAKAEHSIMGNSTVSHNLVLQSNTLQAVDKMSAQEDVSSPLRTSALETVPCVTIKPSKLYAKTPDTDLLATQNLYSSNQSASNDSTPQQPSSTLAAFSTKEVQVGSVSNPDAPLSAPTHAHGIFATQPNLHQHIKLIFGAKVADSISIMSVSFLLSGMLLMFYLVHLA